MTINEFKIKLSGSANIPQPLNLEKDIDMTIKNAETVSSQDQPNGDGTIDRIFKIKITERSEVTISAENEIIKAKKKGSQSQALYNTIRQVWEQQHSGNTELDDFYKKKMSEIIDNFKSKLI